MIDSRYYFLSVAVLLAGCSDPAPVEHTTAPDPVESVPVAMTSGTLELSGLPDVGETFIEVMVVSELEAEARQRLERQRTLFERKLTGAAASDQPVVEPIPNVSPGDSEKLQADWAELRNNFPALSRVEVDEGNNRLRIFQSDGALHREYEYLFGALNWDNLERGLNFIREKIVEDRQMIATRVESDQGDRLTQAEIDLAWIGQVEEHFRAYLRLARQWVAAQNRLTRQMARMPQSAAEPETWEAYAVVYADTLIIDLSLNLIGSAYVESDRTFDVEGHGILVVAINYDGNLVYFLPEAEDESRISVVGLRRWERTVAETGE